MKFFPALLIAFLLVASTSVSAQEIQFRKKKKNAIVNPDDVEYTTISITTGKKKRKKTKEKEVACHQSKAGKAKSTKKGLKFTTYAKLLKKARKKNQSKKKIKNLRKIMKLANRACKDGAGGPGGDTGGTESLNPYQGEFGPAEARLLYERFAFAGSPQDIQQAVADGMQATVVKLTTLKPEPELDALVADLECDGRLPDDEDNESCNPANPNDLDERGMRYGLYARFQHSINPFFYKLMFFLHDERMSASLNALSTSERHALRSHVAMLLRASYSGDYRQFMYDWSNDHMGHLRWLDGAANEGSSPNENYAREFWELGTLGTTNLDGTLVYTDLDVAQSALAFTGWTMIRDEILEDVWVTFPAYSTALHYTGPKTIFGGTPYEVIVEKQEDVVAATFRHPRTAEHLAEDLWKEYISPSASPRAIRQLAELIREHNYNLIPVLRVLMQSRALYDPRSRKSIIKHPIEMVFGFIRTVQYPLDYRTIDDYLSSLAQRPLLPATVFGWDVNQLAGEHYVLPWRNVVISMMNRGSSLIDEDNYDIRQRWFSGLGEGSQSAAFIDRMSAWFNVSLSEHQKGQLDQYLNYYRTECRSWYVNEFGCVEGEMFLKRDVFDANPDTEENNIKKAQGLLAVLLTLPEYRLK